MRSFILAVAVAIFLACLFALTLDFVQKPVAIAFRTESVAPIDQGRAAMSDGVTGLGDFLSANFLSAIIGGAIGGLIGVFGAKSAAKMQVKALEEQLDAERARFQQTRHQKKYAMALALRLEVERIRDTSEKRITLAEQSCNGTKHPPREHMIIAVLPLIRGEREDIALLGDELQDKVLALTRSVDGYDAHIETIPPSPGGPIKIDQEALQKLRELKTSATSVGTDLSEFINKVREWRCQKCKAFLDEILDASKDGQRGRCPICGDTTRAIGASVGMDGRGGTTA